MSHCSRMCGRNGTRGGEEWRTQFKLFIIGLWILYFLTMASMTFLYNYLKQRKRLLHRILLQIDWETEQNAYSFGSSMLGRGGKFKYYILKAHKATIQCCQ